jgi:hypothetical protein
LPVFATKRIDLNNTAYLPGVNNKNLNLVLHNCMFVLLGSCYQKLLLLSTKNNDSIKKISMKTKMKLIASLKIWVVIYPSITLFLYLFGKPLSVLPLYQRTFLLTISLVPWIMFVGLPFVDSIITRVSAKNKASE